MKKISNDNGVILALAAKTGRILACKADGSGSYTLLEGCGGTPDGIAVDIERRHIYWTNMGEHWDKNDGFIERCDFDGKDRQVIVAKGATFTPKQLQLDLSTRLMYWCDREGMRVLRAGMDGSNITVLVEAGQGHDDRKQETRHCVGIALDTANGFLYWSQKGAPNAGEGVIYRAPLELPNCFNPIYKGDIEVMWKDLPEPIDLEVDEATGDLYWTDRGDPPMGNSLNRGSMLSAGSGKYAVLCTGLQEAIGLALDLENERAFISDLGGNIYSCGIDGADLGVLYNFGETMTGVVYLPAGL